MNHIWKDILHNFQSLIKKPNIFEPGESCFWNNPHISKALLKAHLDANIDVASRKHATIDKEIEHILKLKIFKPGDHVLDLGCGPGLYAKRFAVHGIKVTGIDISEGTLDYAKKQAVLEGLDINYLHMSFFDMDFKEEFDGIIQTNGELSTFSDDERDLLLNKLYHALSSGGKLVFDVTTRNLRKKNKLENRWYAAETGFWRATPHVVLEQGYDYPEENVYLNRHVVIDENEMTDYRFWFHDYRIETIEPVLKNAGFKITQVWNDFTGEPYNPNGDWLAIESKKF